MWQAIQTAPRDGTWILLEGEFSGGDTTRVKIGRYEPRAFSTGIYEWRVPVDDVHWADNFEWTEEKIWDWYSEGRVLGWSPLPALTREGK